MYPTATELPVRAYDNVNESTKNAQQDAMLNPRFYTTDFAKIDALRITPAHQQMWDTYDANKYKMQSESRRIRTELWDPSLAPHSACSSVDLHINSGKDYWTNPFAPDEDSAPASA